MLDIQPNLDANLVFCQLNVLSDRVTFCVEWLLITRKEISWQDGQKNLRSRITAWVQSLECTWGKERTGYYMVSSDLYMGTIAPSYSPHVHMHVYRENIAVWSKILVAAPVDRGLLFCKQVEHIACRERNHCLTYND